MMSEIDPVIPKTSKLAVTSMVLSLLVCIPFVPSLLAVVLGIIALVKISRSDGALKGTGYAIFGVSFSVVSTVFLLPIFVALLLPAVQTARNFERLKLTKNTLLDITIGLHNFESQHNRLPDTEPELPAELKQELQGKRLLSWRVHLLPFLNQDALYRQFKLNEPWDSPANSKLISQMPTIYTQPFSSLPQTEGKTSFQLAVGAGTLFETNQPHSIAEVAAKDGAAGTILLVVTDDEHAVIWTAPQDYDVANIPAGLQNMGGRTLTATFDANIQGWNLDVAPEVWRGRTTFNGGESSPLE